MYAHRQTACRSWFLAFGLGGALLAAGAPAACADPAPRLGTNLTTLTDASAERPFLDLFKQSRGWITQCAADPDCGWQWDTGEANRLDLDAQGWVRSLPAREVRGYNAVGTLLQPAGLPAGRYLLLYEGRGQLAYALAARRIDAQSSPGRDVLEIDPARGAIHIQIRATDPDGSGDYLRNLRLVREADELLLGVETFSADFLARSAPYQALRFTDWMRIKGDPADRWADRPLPDNARYTGPGGVPMEQLVALANRLGAAPWLSIPHRADDDYVEQMAALVRDSLDPSLPVYLEYSAEVWQSASARYQWLERQGQAAWPGGGASGFTKALNWYGRRSAEVCDLWKQAFGDQAGRITCVVASQAENVGVGATALACSLWTEGAPCREHGLDALAIAPFFGTYLGNPAHAAAVGGWTKQDDGGLATLFSELAYGGLLPGSTNAPADGALEQVRAQIEAHAAFARAKDVALLGYSGGQHLVGYWGVEWNKAIVDLFTSANRDPHMGTLYDAFLTIWDDAGGALLMHDTDIAASNRTGSAGALEDAGQVSAPKYDALRAYLGPDGLGRVRLGTNLSSLNDWSSERPFTDLFKLSRDWITQCVQYGEHPDPGCTGQWDTGEAALLDLDEHGWVRSLPAPADAPLFTRATTYWALDADFPGGRYRVLYEGSGSIVYGLGARRIAADSRPGSDLIEIAAGNAQGMTLTIAATDPAHTGDYLRNLRVLPEAAADALAAGTEPDLFNPDFIARVAPFEVLRFMDWMRTNDSTLVDWADRPRLEDARWTTAGAPLEVLLALSERSDADPWLNVPHGATDPAVTALAEQVRDTVDNRHRVFVELSNEIWNQIMPQHDDALARARSLWPGARVDDFTLLLNWYGKRTAEVCDIFKSAFGDEAYRVHCVIGAQSANPYTARQALDCPLWSAGPCSDHGLDAVAIAPYFGGYLAAPEVRAEVLAWTNQADGGLDALFTELTQGGGLSNSPGGVLAQVGEQVAAYRALADERGLCLIAYEGGQHLADTFGTLPAAIKALFTAANRSERMGALYDAYLAAWQRAGGGLFVNYTDIAAPGTYGAWGVLESVAQTSSPKYDALLRYRAGLSGIE